MSAKIVAEGFCIFGVVAEGHFLLSEAKNKKAHCITFVDMDALFSRFDIMSRLWKTWCTMLMHFHRREYDRSKISRLAFYGFDFANFMLRQMLVLSLGIMQVTSPVLYRHDERFVLL